MKYGASIHTCPQQKTERARKKALNIEVQTIRSFLLAFWRAITLHDRL